MLTKLFNKMKKRNWYLFITFSLGLLMILTSFGGGDESDYPGGSPAGYTGSPGDGQDCQACHGGTTSFVSGWITSDIPSQGYTPGSTYNITVTVTGVGSKGFQVSPQNPTGDLLGTLYAGSGSELNGGGKYITQSSASSSNPKSWVFQWKAPAAGTGQVTFYGAFTINKPVTKTSTLTVNENSSASLSVQVTATPSLIFLGDSSQLNAVPTGGSGVYTFIWRSIPTGFSSTLQNPYASPLTNTTYTVECSDGVQTVSASVDVAVQYHVGLGKTEDDQLLVYPNPTAEKINISLNSTEPVVVKVITLSGTQSLTFQLTPVEGVVKNALDLSPLQPGIYFLSVGNEHFSTTKKIVVTK